MGSEMGIRASPRAASGGPRKPRPSDEVVFASLTDVSGASFDTAPMTYKPARFEEAWLNEALGPFIHAALLTDVLRLVKGGKEANVYLCAAHPNLGICPLYTSPSPRDRTRSRMPSSA